MSLKAGLASLVILGISLSACGGSATSSAPPKTSTSGKVTTTTGAAATTSSPDTTLVGTPTVVQTAESPKLAEEWACNYEDEIISSISAGPSQNLFSQVGFDTVEVEGLSYQAATYSSTSPHPGAEMLYMDAQAQETFASSVTNVNWSKPASFFNGGPPKAVMKDCDAVTK